MMERVQVQSSNIRSIGYDPATRTMHVEFAGNKVYEFPDVPADTHAAFMAAESKGQHFYRHIRPVHNGRRLETV